MSHDKGQAHQEAGGYQNLTPVAWAILVMGLSLAAVIILYVYQTTLQVLNEFKLLPAKDYYEDGNHNVYLDSWSKHPLFCKDCHVQQRCDLEGRLYCPSDGLKEDIPIKIKSISNPNPLVANTTKNLPKNYFPPLATQLHSTERKYDYFEDDNHNVFLDSWAVFV